MKNEIDTYKALVFAPDYSTAVLATKMFTNSNEHSIYIRFLWVGHLAFKIRPQSPNEK